MDNQSKNRSNNYVNDQHSNNQGDNNSFSSVDESASERKRRRTNGHGGTGRATIIAGHQSQNTSSQLNLNPLQNFVVQPSASQLLLHLVVRYMAFQLSQDHQSSPRNEVPIRGAGFSNQPTGRDSSFSRNENQLQGGSFVVGQSRPSMTTSPCLFQSSAAPNANTSNSDDSSAIQNIINILLQHRSSSQQTNPLHPQTQQNPWVSGTNHAPPWSNQDRASCTSVPERNPVSNQESIVSMLTQSASRLLDEGQGHGLSSASLPVLARNEHCTSAPLIYGGASGLTDMMVKLRQGAASIDERNGQDTSRNISSEPSRLDLLQVLRQSGPVTNDHLVNSSQNPFRNISDGVSTSIPFSGNSMTQTADSERILTELLLQVLGQRTPIGNDLQNRRNDTTVAQQSAQIPLPLIQRSEKECQGREEDTRHLTGRANLILAMSCDKDMLSPYQCLVRQQIELFEAKQEDINTNAQGRNRPIVLGQVGIRCRHCSFLALHLRSRGSTYYPSTATGLYQAAQNLASGHLCDHCGNIPSSVKDELRQLRERKSSAGGGKKYWADGVRSLGVFEDAHGLRFAKENRR